MKIYVINTEIKNLKDRLNDFIKEHPQALIVNTTQSVYHEDNPYYDVLYTILYTEPDHTIPPVILNSNQTISEGLQA